MTGRRGDARSPAWWRSRTALFIGIVVLGTLLRVGYGVARYQDALGRTGHDFVVMWDHDALEHVLIARSILEEGTYRVGAPTPELAAKNVRYGNEDALFKAPLYQYFLAGVFAISGLGFALFFPLQALLGGLAAGFLALIGRDLFGSWRVGAYAGLAAAAHPVLVNAASQPYNEPLFLALLLGTIWCFVRWLKTGAVRDVLGCGLLGGLAILCRETAGPLLLVLLAYALVARPFGVRRAVAATAVTAGVAALLVIPWSIRNYLSTGAVVPVSAISGTALSMGNNECVAGEPLFSWYWAEGTCPPLQAERDRRMLPLSASERDSSVVQNQMNTSLGMQFVTDRPVDFLALIARRAATLFVPFHPLQALSRGQVLVLTTYWLLVIPLGVVGLAGSIRRREPSGLLLGLLIAAIVAPQILVYFSPDMRYRIAADLLLACFAGAWLVRVSGRVAVPRAARVPGTVTPA